jgi:transcription-repair coupling factor (superfamily II helicase)
LAIATAIKNESRLFVVLTPDSQTALRLEHELSFFLQDEYPILHFPDWEVLPYDVFSPLPEIVSERLKALAKLPEVTRGALVLSVNNRATHCKLGMLYHLRDALITDGFQLNSIQVEIKLTAYVDSKTIG